MHPPITPITPPMDPPLITECDAKFSGEISGMTSGKTHMEFMERSCSDNQGIIRASTGSHTEALKNIGQPIYIYTHAIKKTTKKNNKKTVISINGALE